jgi:hypothetical protein
LNRYRKKPVVIKAWKIENLEDIQRLEKVEPVLITQHSVYDALHGTWVSYEFGDWIIKGVKGEFYPCKSDVFEETYEKETSNDPR